MSSSHTDCGCDKPKCGCDANTDCSCDDPCVKCNQSYTLKKDCCNRCGVTSCNDSTTCCGGCGGEGPEEVTAEELNGECAWLWMTINRNCCQQPKRVSPNRWVQHILSGIDPETLIPTGVIEQKVCDLFDAKAATFVTLTQFDGLNAKVIKNCQDIASINTYLSGLNIVTSTEVNTLINQALAGVSGGLSESAINLLISNALQSYYTRTAVNDLVAGLQNQINTLQAQLNACDCGGTSFTAPTLALNDILSDECPVSVEAVLVDADPVNPDYTFSSTGAGVVGVAVNNVPVSSPFTASDGDTIEVSVTAAAGVNAVGVVTIEWSDGTNSGILDGVQYDITCPTVTNPFTSDCSQVTGQTVTDGSAITPINFGAAFTGATSYAIVPAVAGLSVSASGVVTGTPTGGVDVYTVTVEATDGTTTLSCAVDITVETLAEPLSFVGGCPLTVDSPEGAFIDVGVIQGGTAPFNVTGSTGLPTGSSYTVIDNDLILSNIEQGTYFTTVTITDSSTTPQTLLCNVTLNIEQ